jgi:hypothetical protein
LIRHGLLCARLGTPRCDLRLLGRLGRRVSLEERRRQPAPPDPALVRLDDTIDEVLLGASLVEAKLFAAHFELLDRQLPQRCFRVACLLDRVIAVGVRTLEDRLNVKK